MLNTIITEKKNALGVFKKVSKPDWRTWESMKRKTTIKKLKTEAYLQKIHWKIGVK